jgi:hypothetical protein
LALSAGKVLATIAVIGGLGGGGVAVAVHTRHGAPFASSAVVSSPPHSVAAPPTAALTLTGSPTETNAPQPAEAPATSKAAVEATPWPAGPMQPALSPPVTERANSLESETSLLREADRELRSGQPAGALALLDEHASSFSNGALVEERTVERILALCALGRKSEAVSESARFLRERPRSLLADRVRASCGGAGASREQGSDQGTDAGS